MIEFTSNVKFDESVTVTDIDDKNTLFINDLSRQEFNELIGVIALAITGEELPEDDSDDLFQSTDIADDPFADMDTDYDDLFTNTIEDDYVTDDTVENTVIPDLVVRDDTENNAAEGQNKGPFGGCNRPFGRAQPARNHSPLDSGAGERHRNYHCKTAFRRNRLQLCKPRFGGQNCCNPLLHRRNLKLPSPL